jgi:hypothetical protein
LSRWLSVVCVGTTFAVLSVAACSVPEFEFPGPTPGIGGDGSVVIDHCVNGLLDAELGETDFDCGGGCNPCGLGQHCGSVADCAEGLCHEGTCIAEGCMNSVQDGAESDVDCGGGGCNTCITGQSCGVESDCESGVCFEAKCLAAACDDQVKNGKETAQDCGGDCPGCAVDQPCVSGDDCISLECVDTVCGPECPDGFANCDKQNTNACEINVRTDVLNCGSCGNACDLPHATPECSAGECRITTDGCEAGFADCNGLPEDGCEVNLAQDKDNCGVCNKVCPALNGAPFCAASACQITCSQGFDDCDDNRDNGCEKDVSRDVNNCGECNKKCTPQNGGTSYCKNDTCGETICPAGFGDCNGEPDDGPNGNGCEVDLRIDENNCNTCGNICVANNATTACVNRVCQIDQCASGYDDCGNGYADGCETNINTSTSHCGGCGQGCSIANGTPKCDVGDCAINSCSGTFRDCDSSPDNGCEINIATNTKNCGGCGIDGSDCGTKYANATSSCSMSACTAPTCNANYGDCTGGLADGCETDTRTATSHCGGCGQACLQAAMGANVSSNNCVASQCDPQCVGAFDTCDNDKFNGCEANTDDDEAHCGGCGIGCSTAPAAHVSSNDCVSGDCDPQCSGTYGDCDASRTNGCETNTATSNSNCGGCGVAFACKQPADTTAHVTSNNCSGSDCNPVCNGLWDDCDTSRFNGCEQDVSGDESNCGGCDVVCGTTNASGTTCSSGNCNPNCNSGWGDCTSPELGCTVPLGTTTNCTACGDSCTSGAPFCEPAGCVAFRDIVVGPNGVRDIAGWDGNNGNSEITLNHTISYAKGENRMVLVGLVASDPFTAITDPMDMTKPVIAVTYDQKPMTRFATHAVDASKQSWAVVYYMLDADLPNSANTVSPVTAKFWTGAQWGHGGIDVLELKNAEQAAPFASGTNSGGNCGGSTTRGATVTFTGTQYTKSLVYGVLSARGATGATMSAASGLTESWNEHQVSPNNHVGAAAWVIDNDTRTINWSVATCYNSATLLVAVQRLTAP